MIYVPRIHKTTGLNVLARFERVEGKDEAAIVAQLEAVGYCKVSDWWLNIGRMVAEGSAQDLSGEQILGVTILVKGEAPSIEIMHAGNYPDEMALIVSRKFYDEGGRGVGGAREWWTTLSKHELAGWMKLFEITIESSSVGPDPFSCVNLIQR